MTRSRYALAAILQSFGVIRKNKRLNDAATELHLMQDGEELLGSFCWRNLEEIEDLSMEYWNLRRLDRQAKAIIENLNEAEKTLADAQINRADLIARSKGIGQELFEDRDLLFEKIESLNVRRDEIMAEATAIKRKYAALKMKAQVLLEEEAENKEKLTQCSEDLFRLRKEFDEGKTQLKEVSDKIDELEGKLTILQERIDSKLEGTKGEATESFAKISKANRDITKYQAALGLIQDEQAKIFREVGRFLNLNADRIDCRKACQGYRGLQLQTRLLYRSVKWNRKLVERVSVERVSQARHK
jgi:chromosome segregation ATPase